MSVEAVIDEALRLLCVCEGGRGVRVLSFLDVFWGVGLQGLSGFGF